MLIKGKKNDKRPLIGLALGGGGAKGMAELGVLKALEENGIYFDMVSGTSIGSIIGACYATGYSSGDMQALIRALDFSEIRTLTMLKMSTEPVEFALVKALGDLTFEELKKPFFCYATEIKTGAGREFSEGSIIKPIAASCAMPPFFKPVKIDDKYYCDGAYVNLIPADCLKNRGCKFVLGVDLSVYNEKKKDFSLLDLIGYKVPILGDGKKPGYDNADIMLKPLLKGYTALSVDRLEQMFELGYNEAVWNMPSIKQALKDIGMYDKKGKWLGLTW